MNGCGSKECVDQFLNELMNYPERFTERMDTEACNSQYRFDDTEFWNNYVVDTENFSYSHFSYKNPLYLYTPKIYKIRGNYYIQILKNRLRMRQPDVLLVKESLAHLLEYGILPSFDRKNIYIVEENGTTKIKFKVFMPVESSIDFFDTFKY